MKLFLVRHGETDVNRVLGHGVSDPVMHSDPVLFEPGQDTDIALNVYGRAQATVAGEILPDDIDAIFSSPLLRVKETAEIIAAIKGMDASSISIRNELREYHQGTLDGLSTEQKKIAVGGQTWGSGLLCTYDYTPWGGDSWETIYARLSSFIDELKKTDIKGNVLCVTSAGVIRMAYKLMLWDKAPGITKHIVIHNGSVHEFVL